MMIQPFRERSARDLPAVPASTGSCTRLEPESLPEPLVVTTWNINAPRNPEGIARELEQPTLARSTVIALQEVRTRASGHAEVLAERLGVHYHYAGRDVILSRHPIERAGSLRINRTGRQTPWADLRVNGGLTVRVYAPHLTYKRERFLIRIPNHRGEEMRRVLDHADASGLPAIIAGDLNSVGDVFFGHHREPCVQHCLTRGYAHALATASGSTHRVLGRLDWIFARGFHVRSALRGRFAGSDHRWMQAELLPFAP